MDQVIEFQLATSDFSPPSPSSSLACYFVYMLVSCDKKRTYIGCTNNLKKRLRQHNGEIVGGARATARSRPWTFFGFCYCTSCPLNRSEACRLETHWKRASFSETKKRSKYKKISQEDNKFLKSDFDFDLESKRIQNRLLGIQKACNFLSYSFQLKKLN